MANGVTSRPLTRLNPLELTSKQDDHTFEESRENSEQPASNHASEQPAGNLVSESWHPKWASARRAAKQFRDWANILSDPPEDVAMAEQ